MFKAAAPDPVHTARYAAELGFAPGTLALPYAYLAVQRAHLATMLADDFPFRLPGMLHVENALVAYAPVVPGRPLRLETALRIEAPTASGARFCVLDTTAWDGAQRVFGCSSKYLAPARTAHGKARTVPEPPPSLPHVGAWRVTRADALRYARLSGDWNPIHLSRTAARLFGLRAPIIHGMHSVARAVALLEAHTGCRVTAVSVRFRSTVPLGSEVTMLHAPGSAADIGTFMLVCAGRVVVEGDFSLAQAA